MSEDETVKTLLRGVIEKMKEKQTKTQRAKTTDAQYLGQALAQFFNYNTQIYYVFEKALEEAGHDDDVKLFNKLFIGNKF